jgi:opacity protein-like surface antigen
MPYPLVTRGTRGTCSQDEALSSMDQIFFCDTLSLPKSTSRKRMKGLLRYFFVIGIILANEVYAFCEPVELYNQGEDPCCLMDTFNGLYVAANGGYSWYRFNLHLTSETNLLPLNSPSKRLTQLVPVIAVGFDFFPKKKFPVRLELNFLYSDVVFSNDPLFSPACDSNTFANDEFNIYNTMLTLYLDWHTCTRFVPFVGLSAGYDKHTGNHHIRSHDCELMDNFSATVHGFSFGGTLGTRFFFTNHVVANLQFRFDDLRKLQFTESTATATTPMLAGYISNDFHVTTIMVGIGYEF